MAAFIARDMKSEQFTFSVPAGKKMGHGFINATGGPVKKSGSNNLGAPTEIDSLTFVTVSYKYNDASKSWHINTMYPSNK